MKKLFYLALLFLTSCEDHCETKTTFFKSGELKTLQKNINCKLTYGIENIVYNKYGSIIQIEHRFYKNDSISRKLYFNNGNLKSTYFEINKNKTGKHIKFFKNGGVRSITPYLNGNKHGNSFEWYENGKVRKQVTYKINKFTLQ